MIGRLGVRLVAGLALVALVAGVPAMLAALIGWPLPSQPPSWDEVTVILTSAPTERLVMHTLAVLAWAVWAAFIASLGCEVVALARHGLTDRRGQPTGGNPARGVALLLFTALATGSIGHSTATAVAAYSQPAAAVEVVTEIGPGATVTETAGQAAPTSSPQPTPRAGYLWEDPPLVLAAQHSADAIAVEVAGQRHQVPVAADATLWDLAEMVLGDARRWPEIRDLNPGCYPGGAVDGQVMLLPADAITPAASPVDHTSDASGDDEQDPAVELTYEVAKGDWMWHIAGRYLGDEQRFGEIAELNPQLARQYEDFPDHIQPGDELVLPDDASDSGPRPHATGQADGEPAQPPAQPETPEPAKPPPPESPAEAPQPSPPPATTSPAPPATASPTPAEPSAATPGDATPAEQPEPPAAEPDDPDDPDDPPGVVLPSGSWISFGLAALVAALAVVLRLNRRRRARLSFPIPPAALAEEAPVPESLRPAEAAGRPQLDLDFDADSDLAGIVPGPPSPTAAVGVDQRGDPLGLFALPGEVIYLHGAGAVPAARAALAAACATGVTEHPLARPQVVTTGETLAQLLPANAPIQGLDPDGHTFDGEHLHIAPGAAEAIELAEQEMVSRWRHLDQNDADTVAVLNARDDAEPLPPFLLLLDTPGRHWPRLSALATSRASLGIHVMVLHHPGGVPGLQVQPDGTVSHDGDQPDEAIPAGRLSTLTADELADLIDLVRQAQPHPEPEPEPASDRPPAVASGGGPAPLAVEIPHPRGEQEPPVRLRVLGPVTLATAAGAVTSGVRARGYAVLALLSAHPAGRTLEQLADDLHHAGEGVQDMRAALRADINSVRATLRKATGITGKFLLQAGGRYRIDPDLIDVDLWRMLAHIDAANQATDDEAACLAALQTAADYYQGDFATGQDMPVFIDHATSYRHQILSVYGKIAEIVELDNPDQAVTVLETAAELDPFNEELHQRIMRIHGRAGRPEQVRRTLRRLEARLAEMGHAEPSAATRRVAARQLAATPTDADQSLQPVPSPVGRSQP
jgi:DNA-binding SARP family transcriptional activator